MVRPAWAANRAVTAECDRYDQLGTEHQQHDGDDLDHRHDATGTGTSTGTGTTTGIGTTSGSTSDTSRGY